MPDREMLRRLALAAADDKAVNYGQDRALKLLMVWDVFGKCRAYGVDVDNLHWSVPDLDGIDKSYSLPI
jgi:hypothetical protein